MNIFVKDRGFYKSLVSIAVPILLQNIISFGVNMMDTVMLGKFGEVALSGSSMANQYFVIFNMITLGLGGGAAVITAQYWGKKEIQPIKEMTSILMRMAICISIVFGALAAIFPTQILTIYTNDREVIAAGAKYLRILSISFLFFGVSMSATGILRSIGVVRLPLCTSIGSFILNIFFNYVFIFGKFGAPRMELAGAAVGTVIARGFEFCVMGGYLFFFNKRLNFRLRDMRLFSRSMLKSYAKSGLPVLVSDFVTVLSISITSIIIGHCGQEYIAANSIVSIVNNLVGLITMSLAAASSIITGNTVGAGGRDMAYRQGITIIALGVLLGIFGSVILLLIQTPFIGIYDVGEVTKNFAHQMLNALAGLFIFQSLDGLLTKGILRGGGDTKYLLFGDPVFIWIISIPFGYLAAFVWDFPVWGIFLALNSDRFVKVIINLVRFFSRRWIKDITVS